MIQSSSRSAAAPHLEVPDPDPLHEKLWALRAASGPNALPDEHRVGAITGCTHNGIDTRRRIIDSGRDIKVPDIFERGPVPFADMTLLERLNVLAAALGPKPNKNELAATLIIACIEEGVRDKSGIIDMVSRVGLNPRHVAAILTNERDGAYRARWTCGADGKYRVTSSF